MFSVISSTLASSPHTPASRPRSPNDLLALFRYPQDPYTMENRPRPRRFSSGRCSWSSPRKRGLMVDLTELRQYPAAPPQPLPGRPQPRHSASVASISRTVGLVGTVLALVLRPGGRAGGDEKCARSGAVARPWALGPDPQVPLGEGDSGGPGSRSGGAGKGTGGASAGAVCHATPRPWHGPPTVRLCGTRG